MNEVWKDIPNSNNQYQVSSLGNVRSLYSIHSGKIVCRTKMLKRKRTTSGYPSVRIMYNGRRRDVMIHRLVALAFVPNPEDKPQVNHIDADKTNACASNLEWVTPKENAQHAKENGLIKKVCGSNHPMSSPVAQYTYDGELIRRWDSPYEAHVSCGFKIRRINHCASGYAKSYHGYQWIRLGRNEVAPQHIPPYINPTKPQRILQRAVDGSFIINWQSLSDAAKHNKIGFRALKRLINENSGEVVMGCTWEPFEY